MMKEVRQIQRKLKMFMLAVLCLVLAVPAPVSAASASIKLNASKKTLTVGSSVKLKATVTGKSSTVTWKSSNSAVAAVSKSGKVTAKKAGKATITAKANGKTAKCVITVKSRNYKGTYRRNWKPISAVFGFTQLGSYYTVEISQCTSTKIVFQIKYYMPRLETTDSTNIITAKRKGNKVSFQYKGSWGGSGSGILVLGENSLKVKIKDQSSLLYMGSGYAVFEKEE